MKAADAKVIADDLIALNALTNSSYVSNHGIQEAAKLANIILDLVTQIEQLEANGEVFAVAVAPVELTTPKKRGRPPKAK